MGYIGRKLDENFDFVIGNTGDVDDVADVENLKKDLSVMITEVINNHGMGTVFTDNDALTLESKLTSRIEDDERIREVLVLRVQEPVRSNSITAQIAVDSIYGEISFEEAFG